MVFLMHMINCELFMKFKTIILDRDGVINFVRKNYVKSIDELEFIPGSIKAINMLLSHFNVVVASNQAGIGKGIFGEKELCDIERDINSKLERNIEFYYCKHQIQDNCNCRKPEPGMLLEIKLKYPGPYLFIGDNKTDFWAAKNAKVDFYFVKTGYGDKHHHLVPNENLIFENLESLTKWVLGR